MEMFRKTSILKHFFYFLIEITPIHHCHWMFDIWRFPLIFTTESRTLVLSSSLHPTLPCPPSLPIIVIVYLQCRVRYELSLPYY